MINRFAKFYTKDYPLIFLFLIGFFSFGLLKIPYFLADFWFSKWIVAYILTICLSFWVGLQDKEILLPLFPTLWRWGIGILLLLLIYNHYSHQLSFLSQAFWDRLSFFLLTISFYNIFKNDPFFIKKILGSLFIANAIFLLLNLPNFYLFFLQGASDPDLLYGSFGNINMSAEFVGISLILMIVSRSQFSYFKRLIDTFICLSIIYCYYAFSRSVIIAIIIPLTIIAFKNLPFKKFLKYVVGGCLLVFTLIFISDSFLKIAVTSNTSVLDPSYMKLSSDSSILIPSYQKFSSDIGRWQIIKATWELIKDHPWGIGAGNYLFSLIPYFSYLMPPFNEKEIVQSPHNEYLRFLAEEGWLFTLIVVLWIGSYLFYFRKQINTLFKDHLPVTAFFLFIGLQNAFQFPLINGFPFFMVACFTGYAFSVLHPEGIKINPSGWIFISFLNSAMVIGGIVSYFLSFSYPYSASLNKIAYQLNRDNWQAAIASAQSALKDGNSAGANIILDQELQRHPHNYIALTVKANMAHERSYYDEECSLLKQIDAYFLNQSSYHDYIINHCKND